MFLDQRPSSKSPHTLRRRYQAVRDRQQENRFRVCSQGRDIDGSGEIELSMHLPTEPFSILSALSLYLRIR